MRGCRFLAWVVAVIVALPALAIPSAGDGIISVHVPDAFEKWGLAREDTQFGLVNLEDGLEQLIIAVNVGADELSRGDRAVWLFPVPSDAEDVGIEMLPEVPNLRGDRLSKLVENSLGTDLLMVCSSQIYPLVFALPFLVGSSISYSLLPKYGLGGNVTNVYEHLELFGMTTEVVGTNSSTSLEEYLESKDLSLPSVTTQAIETYIGENFSFVLSWISDTQQFIENNTWHVGDDGQYYYSIGIWISFPSERVFYPLRLTSAYGEDAPPMLLQVMGFVAEVRETRSRNYSSRTQCYVAKSANVDGTLAEFFNIQPPGTETLTLRNLRYTEMMLTTSPSGLSEDLSLEESIPARASFAVFVMDHSWVFAVMTFTLSSMLASLLAGMISFRRRGPAKTMFALLGLFNFATIIGLWLAARWLRINERFVRTTDLPSEREAIPSYLTVFTVLFIAFVVSSFAAVIELVP